MTKMQFVYEVYDCGEFYMKGNAWEVLKALGLCDRSEVSYYARKQKTYKKRFTIKCIGKFNLETHGPKPRLSKHEYDLEWITIALKYHGNTGYHTDGSEFKEELAQKGIYFEARPSTMFKGDWYLERTDGL